MAMTNAALDEETQTGSTGTDCWQWLSAPRDQRRMESGGLWSGRRKGRRAVAGAGLFWCCSGSMRPLLSGCGRLVKYRAG
jgi:hypothetical protein